MTAPGKYLKLTASEVALLLADDWQRDIELLETSHVRMMGDIDAAADDVVKRPTGKIK